jgi:uncharacterized LabA/DUF88 family protein
MRVAVFVDAGYVYAQGSCALSGLKTPKPREQMVLDESKIADLLKDQAKSSSYGKELLRIYWYDGAPVSGPSPGQARMGKLGDVKLRLGQLNSEGQQKGVDSLIVTDLMELARNKAIGDAVIVTGDEDIRVGVQIAQSLGVRVHLLGFAGPKGSQSISLQQEADTLDIWDRMKVALFLRDTNAKAKPESKPLAANPSTGNPAILVAANKAFHLLRNDSKLYATTLKNILASKDVPGPAVSILKAELIQSFAPAKPTKADHKLGREELKKLLRENTNAH